MHRHENRPPARGLAVCNRARDGLVKRQIDLLHPRTPLCRRHAPVAGHVIDFAENRHRRVGLRRPVAVIGEPRKALVDQRAVELLAEQSGDRQCAGIPGDMTLERLFREPERSQTLGHAVRGMLADEEEFSLRLRILDRDRVALCLSQKSRQNRLPNASSDDDCEENSSRIGRCQWKTETIFSKLRLTPIVTAMFNFLQAGKDRPRGEH